MERKGQRQKTNLTLGVIIQNDYSNISSFHRNFLLFLDSNFTFITASSNKPYQAHFSDKELESVRTEMAFSSILLTK